MAYNNGREDRKWRIWKEAEEKVFGQSVKGFGKQFIFDEYIKAGHLKTEIIAFVFVRCEKLREFAFAQIRKSNFACCAFRKSAAVAFRFADQSFLC